MRSDAGSDRTINMVLGYTRDMGRPQKPLSFLALIFLLSIGLGLVISAGFQADAPRPVWESISGPDESYPPVLLVTIESTRTEHVGPCYGYERRTAPNICGLAADGVLFTKAYSQGSNTKVAIPSLLTSLPPNSAGLPRFSGEDEQYLLNRSSRTFPDRLASAGYRTLGLLGEKGGFNRVLDTWTPYSDAGKEQSTGMIRWIASRWPSTNRGFLWVFPNEPHYPLSPPEPDRRWDTLPHTQSQLRALQQPPSENQSVLAERLGTDALVDLYDAEIRASDRQVGKVLEFFKDNGIYREALIIVTADHGEKVGGGGTGFRWGHDGRPIADLVHIPLIVKFPGNRFAGRRVSQPVRHVDIAPTIDDVLGLQEEYPRTGRSLIPLLEGEDSRRFIYAAAEPDELWSARNETAVRFVEDMAVTCRSNGSDPDTADIPLQWNESARAEVGYGLENRLCAVYRWGERHRVRPVIRPLSDELESRLRGLGYAQ